MGSSKALRHSRKPGWRFPHRKAWSVLPTRAGPPDRDNPRRRLAGVQIGAAMLARRVAAVSGSWFPCRDFTRQN